MKDTVTISSKEYEELVRSQLILSSLEAGGVNNWNWYDDSIDWEQIEKEVASVMSEL